MKYWQKRILQNQNKAEKLASTYASRQAKYFTDAHKIIELRLESLLSDIEAGYTPTRTELWQMVKWTQLREQIERETGVIGRLQTNDIDEIANKVYTETVGLTLREFSEDSKFGVRSEEQTRQILNATWNDVKYSERVWGGNSVSNRIGKNSKVLSQRIEKDLQDLICLGKSPSKIKAQLADDFKVAYHNADRLIRTETNHIYNQAAKDSYKSAGVEKVYVITEPDCCDACAEMDGVEYYIDNAPLLPIHPNCRCCIAPVVSLD